MLKLTKIQEEKRQETLKMLDLCLKLMKDEVLTIDERVFANKYFEKHGLEWKHGR